MCVFAKETLSLESTSRVERQLQQQQTTASAAREGKSGKPVLTS